MNEPDSLCMPVFTFSWPDACSPHAQAVEQHVIGWVEHYQLIPNQALRARTIRARYGWLAARCYPSAPLDLLKTIADFIAWLFLVDDLLFDWAEHLSPRTVAHITAIIDVLDLNDTQVHPGFGERALLDVCQRLRGQMDAEHFEHFAHGTRMVFASTALLILGRLNGEQMALRQYGCARRHGSGVAPCIALLDSATAAPLKSEVRFCPQVQQLKESANTIISLINDIFSVSSELKQPGHSANIVMLLAGQQHSLQEGIELSANKVRIEIERFTKLSEQLLDPASPALNHYIQGLKYWLSGHQRWLENDTARYDSTSFDSDAQQRSIAHAVNYADSVIMP